MSSFTCFEHFGSVLKKLNKEDQGRLSTAIILYGTVGEEPDLDDMLSAIFEALRNDIDNSIKAKEKNRGGRPKKQNIKTCESEESEVIDLENSGFEYTETGVFENENPGFENQEPKLSQTNINQDNKYILSGEETPPYAEIIDYLNSKAGKNFKSSSSATRRKIKARWNEGYRLDDFKSVIDKQCKKWINDQKMVEYLRPETLFGTKFEGYLQSGAAVNPYAIYD